MKFPLAFAQDTIVTIFPYFHRSSGKYSFASLLSQYILVFDVFKPANQEKKKRKEKKLLCKLQISQLLLL
jgi:hypothetical protein